MNLFLNIVLSLVLSFVTLLASFAFFKAFQQRGYKKTGYLKWLYKNDARYVSRAFNVVLFSFMSAILFNVLFSPFLFGFGHYVSLIFYFMFLIIYKRSQEKKTDRQKLEKTSRMKRMMAVSFCLGTLIIFGIFSLMDFLMENEKCKIFDVLAFAPITILPLFFPYFIVLSDLILYPVEKSKRKYYTKKARAKLLTNPDVLCIGITGSFGKTTVKNILGTILSQKYDTFITPKSFNTPMGISKAILENYNNEKIFIAEMGARRRGEIKELAEFIPCDIGLITAVSRQHLEGFKNLNNILDTKFELAENLKEGGVCFYNGDNSCAEGLFERPQGEKVLCGLKKPTAVKISNIEVSQNGSQFDIEIDNEKRSTSTILLGEHNISNIALCLEVALKLGLSIDEMAEGIKKIQAIPHRLELIRPKGAMTIIDDSYNANTVGVKSALAVLKLFENTKIVVTSGFVEMGNMELYENKKLGRRIGEVADKLIIVGARLSKEIAEGATQSGLSEDKIYVVGSLENVVEILKNVATTDSTILFMADFPDTYLK